MTAGSFSILNMSILFLYWQGPVVPQNIYQMDREATPAPLLGAESLTPVTQGTGWLQVVLVEHVSQMVCGQEVILLVHVSSLWYFNTTDVQYVI